MSQSLCERLTGTGQRRNAADEVLDANPIMTAFVEHGEQMIKDLSIQGSESRAAHRYLEQVPANG
jgi:hypothetical protein